MQRMKNAREDGVNGKPLRKQFKFQPALITVVMFLLVSGLAFFKGTQGGVTYKNQKPLYQREFHGYPLQFLGLNCQFSDSRSCTIGMFKPTSMLADVLVFFLSALLIQYSISVARLAFKQSYSSVSSGVRGRLTVRRFLIGSSIAIFGLILLSVIPRALPTCDIYGGLRAGGGPGGQSCQCLGWKYTLQNDAPADGLTITTCIGWRSEVRFFIH